MPSGVLGSSTFYRATADPDVVRGLEKKERKKRTILTVIVVVDLVEAGKATTRREKVEGPVPGLINSNIEVALDVLGVEEGEPGGRAREAPAGAGRETTPRGRTGNSAVAIPTISAAVLDSGN